MLPEVDNEEVTLAEHSDAVQRSSFIVTVSAGTPAPSSRILTISGGVAPPVKSTAVSRTSSTISLVIYGHIAISPRPFSEPTTFLIAACGVVAPVAGANR